MGIGIREIKRWWHLREREREREREKLAQPKRGGEAKCKRDQMDGGLGLVPALFRNRSKYASVHRLLDVFFLCSRQGGLHRSLVTSSKGRELSANRNLSWSSCYRKVAPKGGRRRSSTQIAKTVQQ